MPPPFLFFTMSQDPRIRISRISCISHTHGITVMNSVSKETHCANCRQVEHTREEVRFQVGDSNKQNTTMRTQQQNANNFLKKKCKHQLQNLRDKCISFCAFPILHPLIMPYRLFTGQFGVKATQTNRKSLESRQRIAVIHCEHVLRYLTKLQDDLVLVWWNRL
jgi:hypothetical protein